MSITLDCATCGMVAELDANIVRRILGRLDALAVGHVPLMPIATCPKCHHEVPFRRVTVTR